MARLSITKCQGTGNDFVLIENGAHAPHRYSEIAKIVCDRRFGVGADGLLTIEPPDDPNADARMRIFNADGSEAQMCGNGVRCIARFCFERRAGAPRRLSIQTDAGVVTTEVVATEPEFLVRVDMGIPSGVVVAEKTRRIAGIDAALVDVSMGNPHCVAFIDRPVDGVDLNSFAGSSEIRARFSDGVNVEVANRREASVAMRVHERGVGETWACGTGACAVAVAAIATGRAVSPVRVAMRGGEVDVDWHGPGRRAILTGGAELIFDAQVDVG